MAEDTYRQLQESCGVDFLALREKYRSQAAAANVDPGMAPAIAETGAARMVVGDANKGAPSAASASASHAAASFEELSKYAVCKRCHGMGIVKETYNQFQVCERNCPECDGDSITLSMQEQVSRIQAQLASAGTVNTDAESEDQVP